MSVHPKSFLAFIFCIFHQSVLLLLDVPISLFSSHGQIRLLDTFDFVYVILLCKVLVHVLFHFLAIHEMYISPSEPHSLAFRFFTICFELAQFSHSYLMMGSTYLSRASYLQNGERHLLKQISFSGTSFLLCFLL